MAPQGPTQRRCCEYSTLGPEDSKQVLGHHHTFIEGCCVPALCIPSSPKFQCYSVLVYTDMYKAGNPLMDRLSMDSEPVQAGILRVAPVGQDPKLHYLEGSIRSFHHVEDLK